MERACTSCIITSRKRRGKIFTSVRASTPRPIYKQCFAQFLNARHSTENHDLTEPWTKYWHKSFVKRKTCQTDQYRVFKWSVLAEVWARCCIVFSKLIWSTVTFQHSETDLLIHNFRQKVSQQEDYRSFVTCFLPIVSLIAFLWTKKGKVHILIHRHHHSTNSTIAFFEVEMSEFQELTC